MLESHLPSRTFPGASSCRQKCWLGDLVSSDLGGFPTLMMTCVVSGYCWGVACMFPKPIYDNKKLQYTVVSGVRGRHPHNSLNTEHNLPLRVAFAKWGLKNIFGYHWKFHCMSVVPFNERMITNILFPSCGWWEPTIIIFTVTLQTLRQLQTTFAKNWLLICLMPPNFASGAITLEP